MVQDAMVASADLDQDGVISLKELLTAMRRQSFYGLQHGRYSVIVSLVHFWLIVVHFWLNYAGCGTLLAVRCSMQDASG